MIKEFRKLLEKHVEEITWLGILLVILLFFLLILRTKMWESRISTKWAEVSYLAYTLKYRLIKRKTIGIREVKKILRELNITPDELEKTPLGTIKLSFKTDVINFGKLLTRFEIDKVKVLKLSVNFVSSEDEVNANMLIK